MQVTTAAVRLFDGAGYTQDLLAERMTCDAKITHIHAGAKRVQRMVIARSLLSERLTGVPATQGRGGSPGSCPPPVPPLPL